MESEPRQEDMDLDNHSNAKDQATNFSGSDVNGDVNGEANLPKNNNGKANGEVNLPKNNNGDVNGNTNGDVNGDVKSPASNNLQQQSENVQEEHNEVVVPSCGSNPTLQLPESAPENLLAVGSPPPPLAEVNNSPLVIDSPPTTEDSGDESLENSPPDVASPGNSTTVTESFQVDTDSDADVGNPDQVESMGYGEQGQEIEEEDNGIESDSASDDITYTDDGESDDDDDDVTNGLTFKNASTDQTHRQIIRDSDSDPTGGDFTVMMSGMNASSATATTPFSIADPRDYNPLVHGNNYGPTQHNLPSLPASLPSSPPGFNGWPDYEHGISHPTLESIQRFVRAHNALPNLPVVMPVNDAGHVRAQPVFGQYEQTNREIYPNQQSTAQNNNSDNLPMPGTSRARLVSHWIGGSNQLAQNMTGVNFSWGNAQQRPIFNPSSLPQAPIRMMTSSAMEDPNESLNRFMNGVTYRPRLNVSTNFRLQQQSVQNGSQANFNAPNIVGYTSNQGRMVHLRPQHPLIRQAPPLQPNQTILNPLSPFAVMSSRSPPEQLQIAQFTREMVQPLPRFHMPSILSRAEINENRRPRRLVLDTANSNNTTATLVNFTNARAIEQRAISTPNAGRRSRFNRAAKPQDENGESPLSKRARREASDAMNEDDQDVPQITLPNIAAASQPQQNLNDQVNHLDYGATSSQPPNPRAPILNSVYDPKFERMGLPVDPHLRLFAMSNWNKNKTGK